MKHRVSTVRLKVSSQAQQSTTLSHPTFTVELPFALVKQNEKTSDLVKNSYDTSVGLHVVLNKGYNLIMCIYV